MVRISVKHPYTVIILFVSLVILGLGIAFKPKKKAVRQLSESDIARSQQFAQKQRLIDLARYLNDAAGDTSSRLLYLTSIPHTAVVWDRNEAVTAGQPNSTEEKFTIQLEAGEKEMQTKPLPAGVPFRLVSVPSEVSGEQPPVAPVVNSGDWVIAVARQGAAQVVFSHGIFQNTAPATCDGFPYRQINSSAVISPTLEGGGLFTIQGGLLGLITSCHGAPIVVSTESVREVLRLPISAEDQLQQNAGIRLEPGSSRITLVWTGSVAEHAGLQPGDEILQIDSNDVSEPPGLSAIVAGTARSVTIRRGSRKLRIAFPAEDERLTEASGMRLGTELLTHRPQVVALVEGSGAAQAGIAPGDEITQVNGAPVNTPAQAIARLQAKRQGPVELTIQRGARTAKVVIPHE